MWKNILCICLFIGTHKIKLWLKSEIQCKCYHLRAKLTIYPQNIEIFDFYHNFNLCVCTCFSGQLHELIDVLHSKHITKMYTAYCLQSTETERFLHISCIQLFVECFIFLYIFQRTKKIKNFRVQNTRMRRMHVCQMQARNWKRQMA